MISVTIPNWNGKKYLSVCLESLRRQTHQDFEVILVDNGSDDGSVEFVKDNFPEVRIIRFDRNRGFSAAANAGIEASDGEYVALLNNDTEADSEWLEELKKGLDAHGGFGFCASKILYYDRKDLINSAGDEMSVTGYARCIGNNEIDSGQFNQVREVFGASAAAAMYRKNLFDEVGLFDEDYFAYYEDVDLSFRAQLAGYKCIYIPTAVVYHSGGGATKQFSDFDTFYIERNSLFNIIKDMPSPILRHYLRRIIRANLGRGVTLFSRRRFTIWARAKLSAIFYIEKMMRKRRKIQRSRLVSIEYLSSLLEVLETQR